MAVSAEKGLELLSIKDGPANKENFPPYILKLCKNQRYKPYALFMDQLHCHKGEEAQKVYRKHDVLPILNVSYSPDFNPIETVFSFVKRIFKRERLSALVNDEEFNLN